MAYDAGAAAEEGRRRRIGWDGVIGNGKWEEIGIWFDSALTFPADLELKLSETIRSLPRPFGEFRDGPEP